MTGPPTESRCLLCGSPLDDATAERTIRNEDGHAVIKRTWPCPGCGAKNTAQDTAHLGLVVNTG